MPVIWMFHEDHGWQPITHGAERAAMEKNGWRKADRDAAHQELLARTNETPIEAEPPKKRGRPRKGD